MFLKVTRIQRFLYICGLFVLTVFALKGPEKTSAIGQWPSAPFAIPSSGYAGYIYYQPVSYGYHAGLDICAAANCSSTGEGNEVRAAYAGKLVAIYDNKFNSVLASNPGAVMVVLEHDNVPGAPVSPIYTWYLHMADEYSAISFVNPLLQLGQYYPMGTLLGHQGNRRILDSSGNPIGDAVTHLHFQVENSSLTTSFGDGACGTIIIGSRSACDPSPLIGPNVNYGINTPPHLNPGDSISANVPLGNISGKVSNSSQNFVIGATVSLSLSSIPPVTTDSSGQYYFYNVPAGPVTVSASDPTYGVGSTSITVNPYTDNQANIAIALQICGSSNPGATVQTSCGSCPAPNLISPLPDYISSSQTIPFSWSPPSGCTFSGYTFRIKDVPNMDSGGNTIVDTGDGNTSWTQTIPTQWDNLDLYWGVRTANPLSPNWSVNHFRIQPGGTGQVTLCTSADGSSGCNSYVPGIYDLSGTSLNDQYQYVKISGGWSIWMFEDNHLQGQSDCTTINRQLPSGAPDDLRGQLTSFQVADHNICQTSEVQSVVLAQHGDGTGPFMGMGNQEGLFNVPSAFNDLANSVYIPNNWSANLYIDANGGGGSQCLSGKVTNLGSIGLGSNISSVEIFFTSNCQHPSPPAAPILQVTDNTQTSITIAWNAVNNATGYNIYKYNWQTMMFAYLTSVGSNSYADTALTCSGSAYYEVTAYNAYGESPPSNYVGYPTKPCMVTNTNDSGPGSLRYVIASATAGVSIIFDPTVFNTPQTITLTSGTLTITQNVIIQGPGANLVAVDGNNTTIVFNINGGVTATISGLTIQHGNAGSGSGGGISIAGTLTVSNSTLSGNSATYGGAIYNNGTLTVSNSTLSGNSATYGGAIFNWSGTAAVSNSTISGNSTSSYGGGIYVGGGTLTVGNSTISNNTTVQSGGGIYQWVVGTINLGSTVVSGNTRSASAPDDISGPISSLGSNLIGNTSDATGFVSNDQLNVDPKLNPLALNAPGTTQTMSLQAGSPAIGKGNCNLSSFAVPVTIDQRGVARKIPCDVGAFETSDLVVHNTNDNGPGSLRYVIANAMTNATITFDSTVFNIPQMITLTNGPLTITQNVTIQGPGANLVAVDGNNTSTVFTINSGVTATISGLTIQHGNAGSGTGGGISNAGSLTINNSTISTNTAGQGGAGIENNHGSLTVSSSTISGNTTSQIGGGIENDYGWLTVSNSTISSNIATKGAAGIFNNTSSTATISNTTISANNGSYGGGIFDAAGPALSLGSTIVAGNTASGDPDIDGYITSLGNNLIGNTSGAGGFVGSDQLNVDPKLNPLALNAPGTTQTMSLQAGSPAIGKGNCVGSTAVTPNAPAVTKDQRGQTRKSPCDVGAYESVRLDTIGIFRSSVSNGTFFMRLHNSTGYADITVTFNPAGKAYPIVGDWTGNGYDTVGVYDQNNGQFTLCTANDTTSCSNLAYRKQFVLGVPNDQPLSGRWKSIDSHDGAGVFRPSNGLIYLKDVLSTGFADYTMVLGIPGDVGLAGDWNGDGLDSLGVYRPSNSVFYLNDQTCNCSLFGTYQFAYGVGGDAPVAGDWIGQGHDGIGLFRRSNGFTYLRNELTTGFADIPFVYGIVGDIPVAGHWQPMYPGPNPSGVLVPPTEAPVATPNPPPTTGLGD